MTLLPPNEQTLAESRRISVGRLTSSLSFAYIHKPPFGKIATYHPINLTIRISRLNQGQTLMHKGEAMEFGA